MTSPAPSRTRRAVRNTRRGCWPPRPKALVSFWGYCDLTAPWACRPDPFYSRSPLVPEEEAARGGKPNQWGGFEQGWKTPLLCPLPPNGIVVEGSDGP